MGQKIWRPWRHGPCTTIFENSGGGGHIQGPGPAAPPGARLLPQFREVCIGWGSKGGGVGGVPPPPPVCWVIKRSPTPVLERGGGGFGWDPPPPIVPSWSPPKAGQKFVNFPFAPKALSASNIERRRGGGSVGGGGGAPPTVHGLIHHYPAPHPPNPHAKHVPKHTHTLEVCMW